MKKSREEVRREKTNFEKNLRRSWENRPSPKNWHEYDEWQKEHYALYTTHHKKHVRARFTRKWQRKPMWKEQQ